MSENGGEGWEHGNFFSALSLQMFTEAVFFSFGILQVKVFHRISKVATQIFFKMITAQHLLKIVFTFAWSVHFLLGLQLTTALSMNILSIIFSIKCLVVCTMKCQRSMKHFDQGFPNPNMMRQGPLVLCTSHGCSVCCHEEVRPQKGFTFRLKSKKFNFCFWKLLKQMRLHII